MKRKNKKILYRPPLPPGSKILFFSPGKNEKNEKDKNLLSSWNLPPQILSFYLRKGISRFFDWQVECLQLPDVIEKQHNLVYSAPTSAGKSMVADMLLFKTVLERKKKAIIILPFVSITVEKVQSLKFLCRKLAIRIDTFAGNTNPRGGLARVEVAVCTMEKANNMINKLIENDKLDEIGLIIIDELHMIGNPSRGYILELLLSKILFLKKLNKYSELNLQLVGMSATIPNLSDVAKWLDAKLYITNYRPVPLNEHIVLEKKILQIEYNEQYSNSYNLKTIRNIDFDKIPLEPCELQSLLYLTIETVLDGYSTLIFCRTKAECESLARTISKTIFNIGKNEIGDFKEKLTKANDYEKILTLMKTLRQTSTGLDKNLESTIRFGCGFHHAGLILEERAAIEQAFRDGTLRVLCCTSTLSAGVNLPARRVMITSIYDFANNIIDKTSYCQMIGRAGRKGIDTLGESFIFAKPKDLSTIRNYILTEMKPIKSHLITLKLKNEESGETRSDCEKEERENYFEDNDNDNIYPKLLIDNCIIKTVLEVIANGLAKHLCEINTYLKCTFFANSFSSTATNEDLSYDDICQQSIKKVIDLLIKNNFIFDYNILDKGKSKPIDKDQIDIKITSLGQAIVASGISPSDGLFIFNELQRCREKLCLLNDLHLVYQTTPTYIASQIPNIDWKVYLNIYIKMNDAEKKVADLINIQETFIFSQIMGFDSSEKNKLMTIHRRFYASLALFDLIKEIPVNKVQAKFNLNKGLLQALQQQASSFAGMLTTFCNRLGWSSLELLIEQFQPRISFGVQRELIDLVRIPCINSSIARQLYSKGFDTVVSLIHCKPVDIEVLLINGAKAFMFGNETSNSNLPFIKIYIPALDKYLTIRELSKMIVEESRLLIENDIGQKIDFEEFDHDILSEESESELKEFEVIDHSANESLADEKALKRIKTETGFVQPMEHAQTESLTNPVQTQPIGQTELLTSPVKTQPIVQTESLTIPVKTQPIGQTESLTNPVKSQHIVEFESSECSTQSLKADKPIETKSKKLESPVLLNGDPILKTNFSSTPKTKTKTNDEAVPLNADIDISSIMNKSQLRPINDKNDDLDSLLDVLMKEECSQSNNKIADRPLDKTNKSLSTLSIDIDEQFLFSNNDYNLLDEPKPVEMSRNKSASTVNLKDDFKMENLCSMEISNSSNNSLNPCIETCQTLNNKNAVEQSMDKDKNLNNWNNSLSKPSTSKEFTNNDKEGQNKLSDSITMASLSSIDSGDKICNSEMLSSTQSSFASSSTLSQNEVETFLKLLSTNEIFTKENEISILQDEKFSLKNSSLIYVNNHEECKKFLNDIFNLEKLCSTSKTIAITINLAPGKLENFSVFKKAKKSNSKMALEENEVSIQLKHSALNVVSVFVSVLKDEKVYCIKSNALYYLRDNWFKHLNDEKFCSKQTLSNLENCSSSSSLSATVKQWRFISYDIKLTLKCLYDAFQFDRSFLFYNIEWFDFNVALWLTDPEIKPFVWEKNTATDIAKIAIKYNLDANYFNLFCAKKLSVKNSLNKNDTELALKSLMLFNLVCGFLMRLREQNLYLSYCLIEIPSRICLSIMETNPTLIDLKYMDSLEDTLIKYMDNIETKIFSIVGTPFKLSSPAQVARVLYSQCNLISNYFNVASSPKTINNKKSRNLKGDAIPQHLSTNKTALMKLQQACGNRTNLPQMIMDWRRLNHAVTNTIHTLRHFLRPEHDSLYSLLYCNCSEWTATGRITMSDPNLIGFDKDFQLKASICCCNESISLTQSLTNKSEKLEFKNEETMDIKLRQIIISKKDTNLVTADYCQLELRILAYFSKDDRLSKVLNFVDKDVFKSIASDWKQIPYEKVDYESRQQAKQICYGIIYGMGNSTLAERLDVTKDEASEYKKTFFQQYPKLMRFIDDCVTSCKNLGYIETISGRRRYLPNIHSEDSGDFQRACRQAVNTKIQGSAADILKIAMISVQKQINQKRIGAQFVLQMHDEMMFQVENEYLNQFIHCLKNQMENISNFINVALPVKVMHGLNWSEMVEYKFETEN